MKTLFISDLHLDPERPDIQDCFDEFIDSCLKDAEDIDAIYILGDLFEVWIGDDASIPLYQQSIDKIHLLTLKGIKVYVMHGNRDFLLADEFAASTGCILIPDPYIISLNHEKILLSHGDQFCTDDKEYIQFRDMVRNPGWQNEFLLKKIAERVEIAQTMRQVSRLKGKQQYSIMDVNQNAIDRTLLEYDVKTIIHGHTHRPATHRFKLKNQMVKRIVLPDWTPAAEVLVL